MKRNALSLGLCLLYVAATAACWVEVLIKSGDPKGTFVLKQLPIALQIALADVLGFGSLMTDMSWAAAYAIFFPLTVALLYGLGRVVTWLVLKLV
jgi:hypothetical protein